MTTVRWLKLPQPQAFDIVLTMKNTHLNKVTRLEEVRELLKCSREAIDRAVIQIENADSNELHVQKFKELDAEIERYAQLRIEESELLRVAKPPSF